MGCEFLNSLTCVSKIWIWKHLAFTCAGRKGSLSTHQPIEGDELRALRAWLRLREMRADARSPYLFLSERGPMTRQAFNYLVAQTGKRAKLPSTSIRTCSGTQPATTWPIATTI